jgi:hypothetical protein
MQLAMHRYKLVIDSVGIFEKKHNVITEGVINWKSIQNFWLNLEV